MHIGKSRCIFVSTTNQTNTNSQNTTTMQTQATQVETMLFNAILNYITPNRFDFSGDYKKEMKGQCEALKTVLLRIYGYSENDVMSIIKKAHQEKQNRETHVQNF